MAIKDFEEKQLIVTTYLCCGAKAFRNTFSVTKIYNYWTKNWSADCPHRENGKCAQIYKGKIVQSAAKYRQGINTSQNRQFTRIMENVMSWIRNNYQPKINRKQNNLNFSNMLRLLREQHFKSLLEKIKQSGLGGLSGRGYIIQEVTPHKFCTLQNYNLFNLQTSEIVIGSYDTMCEYIDGLVQDKQKTEAN